MHARFLHPQGDSSETVILTGGGTSDTFGAQCPLVFDPRDMFRPRKVELGIISRSV